MKLKVLQGGREAKLCRCVVCSKQFAAPLDGHADTFFWATIGQDSGFKTDEFDLCRMCTVNLLVEIKSYLNSRLGLNKK